MCCFGHDKAPASKTISAQAPFYGYKKLKFVEMGRTRGPEQGKREEFFVSTQWLDKRWVEGKLTSNINRRSASGAGIYSYKNAVALGAWPPTPGRVIVEVSLWGEVQVYPRGYKSTKAEIHHVYTDNARLAEKIKKAVVGSGIEVSVIRDLSELPRL